MGLTEHRNPHPGPSEPSPDSVRIDIGELVLDGFGHGVDTDRVSAAFQAELTRLVRERGLRLTATDRALDALSGLPPLPANLSSRRLGQALARAVHEGLSAEPGGRAGRGGAR